VYANTERYMYM